MKIFIRTISKLILIVPIILIGQHNNAIEINSQRNRTVIPVMVDSLEFQILLDTGMAFDGLLIYNKELASSIQLNNPIKVRIPGAGDGPPSEAVMDPAGNFSIGNHSFENQKILVLSNGTFSGFPTDGVLGYSIFGHYVVEINYDNNYLILHEQDSFSPDKSWTKILMYFKNNTIPWINVAISIGGESPIELSTYIDFAAGETIELLEKTDQKFILPAELEQVHLGTGLSGEIYGANGEIAELIFGEYSLKNIIAAFVDDEVRSKQVNADGIIGNGSLKYFNLIFDYKNKYLYIKPNKNYQTHLAG